VKRRFTIIAKCFDKRGRLISTGINNYRKSHPVQQHFAEQVGLNEKIYLHAEIQALLRAGDRKVHRITVERYDRQGNPANAEPCPVCKAAITSWGVKEIEFTK
jgi:deoxycytidylate deaminase